MGILNRCTACKRCYDIGDMAAGRRFHCHCGATLAAKRPSAHESPVIRCSSCGGSRPNEAQTCSFCEASFILHERDLQGICPGCLTRVSAKARFCHSCGDGLSAEPVHLPGNDDVALDCPHCGEGAPLQHRALGRRGYISRECHRCGGLWVGHGEFSALVQSATEKGQGGSGHGPLPKGEIDIHAPVRYLKCPQCASVMLRKNYGRTSGVIIDICGQHGVWFDLHEIDQILKWLEAGGVPQNLRAEPLLLTDMAYASPALAQGNRTRLDWLVDSVIALIF